MGGMGVGGSVGSGFGVGGSGGSFLASGDARGPFPYSLVPFSRFDPFFGLGGIEVGGGFGVSGGAARGGVRWVPPLGTPVRKKRSVGSQSCHSCPFSYALIAAL